MTQDRFEVTEMHPRVASLLARDGWFYHHEYPLSNRKRADFIAIQPTTGRLAIIECKIAVSSTEALIDQINDYHRRFNHPHALKWAFIHNTPHSGTIKRLDKHHIVTFPMDYEPDLGPADLGDVAKKAFRRAYLRVKPILDQLQELEHQKQSLIRSLYAKD